MEAGTRVWCRDTVGDEAWFPAEVTKKTDQQLDLVRTDKPEVTLSRKRLKAADSDEPQELKYEGVELANAPLSDEDRELGRDDDLITLPHLHEPAILHAVGDRFYHGKIYTWTGPVLIAVNPFQRLPLYTKEILETYRREGLLRSQNLGGSDEKLGPHIYAIADRSFRQMMTEQRKSQSILISGESGAGKTESTKIVMLYLTTLGSSESEETSDLSVMEKVMQSNPILEAFGNARTLRNDNSSRFGKYMELGFNRRGQLLGAKVQTYLLEKVRLGFHASGERNYHIFYQLLRGATDEQKKKYEFHDGVTQGLELANYFHYTGQGGAPRPRRHSDESTFKETLESMDSMGWSAEKKDMVLALVAGLLHLGQISFTSAEQNGVEVATITEPKIVEDAARLLGVNLEKLQIALTERVMITRGDEIKIQLTPDKAMDARDALAKTIYGALFLWVVEQVNSCIGWENDDEVRSSVGVLDIFGFECFAVNSFEQLCINFTNEALQQQFNQFIFKMEQSEYETEEIAWAFISFPDNQDCLDTIQMKKTGILAMLDDECRLPKGSDRNWASRLYKNFLPKTGMVESENKRFSATPVQKSRSIFCVRHFAGVVQYSAETGFLEKNKDEIPLTAKNLFETASSQLVLDIFAAQMKETEGRAAAAAAAAPAPTPGKPARGKSQPKSKTVGMQFKEQLHSLIENVQKTEPHYIRCLKPNDAAKPKFLTKKRLTEQLRYGGVLEAVRVARAGYPVRMDHSGFFQRYRMNLPAVPDEELPWSMEDEDAKDLCVRLLKTMLDHGQKQKAAGVPDPNEEGISRAEKIRRMQLQPAPMEFPTTDVQLGNNKVFMRKPPHDAMESHRVFHQNASITLIQCWVRGVFRRHKYLILYQSAITVQSFYRGCKGRERWWRLRRDVAGKLLTRVFRMLLVWRPYNKSRKGTIKLQAAYRGFVLRRLLAAIKIQTFFRMRSTHGKYKKLLSASLALQCLLRGRIARKFLHSLKSEQKDIGKLKENNEKLKMEMASLKAMLAAQAKGDASRQEHEKELDEQKKAIESLEKQVAKLEHELEKERTYVKNLEEKLKKQQEEAAQTIQKLKQSLSHAPSRTPHPAPAPPAPLPVPTSHVPQHAPVIRANDPVPEGASVVVKHVVSPEFIAEHEANIAKLHEELEAERKLRRETDGEIIKLRAQISGVELKDSEVTALLAPSLETLAVTETIKEEEETDAASKDQTSSQTAAKPQLKPESTVSQEQVGTSKPVQRQDSTALAEKKKTEDEEFKKIKEAAVTPEVVTALTKLGVDAKSSHVFNDKTEKKGRRSLLQRSPSEYLPMIRRGFSYLNEEKEVEELDVMTLGWKREISNRKEREEALRDEVRRFEIKMKKFSSTLEEGIEVTMWQLNRNAELGQAETDEFALKATHVTLKLERKGEFLRQSALTFGMRGGFMQKAIARNRGMSPGFEPVIP
mmetsp:Transcript_27066/g.41513  ORF Transcript_27066/g.41513 Transcript_27066/m.41513 type:complete len:1447 (+) Transcript_27066:288-4628(+)